jgi:hypothetical protein
MRTLFICICIFIQIILSNAAFAESSAGYALLATRSWTSFACASLASEMKDEKEQERLFTMGYNDGKTAIKAMQEGKISKEDINKGVPVMFLLLLQGPSADFMLGRIYEAAMDNALKDIFKTAGEIQDMNHYEQFKIDLAKDAYHKKNCALIGQKGSQ